MAFRQGWGTTFCPSSGSPQPALADSRLLPRWNLLMIDHRALSSLGTTNLDWLQARHHFCFAGYQRVDRLGWGRLRVLNHNELAAGAATRSSSHTATEFLIFAENDVEIVHGDGRRIHVAAGHAVSIFTGSGIDFGIRNPGSQPARFTTIWLTCDRSEERAVVRKSTPFLDAETFIASGFGDDQADIALNVPARVTRIAVARGAQIETSLATSNSYLLVVEGHVLIGERVAGPCDGLAIREESQVNLTGADDAIVLVMEV